jgi:hypothetical protein
MTTRIDTEDLIRESLKEQYESYSDNMESPKRVHQLLRALRLVHNYYTSSTNHLQPSDQEIEAKRFRRMGYLTMHEGRKAEKKAAKA